MAPTSSTQLRQWLLASLAELGGRASRAETLTYIEGQFGHRLNSEDKESYLSRRGRAEAKWRTNVSWERDKLVKEELLAPNQFNSWALTAKGWMVVCKEFLDHDAADDPLAKFYPKNSADYTAQMSTKALTKRRDHERLIRRFSEWISTRGYEPNNTSVHPRDLVLLGADGHEWLVEAKIVYKGNMMNAVRAALAQLLTYRHFLYRNEGPRLVALFNEPVDDAFVSLLESLQIESVWLDGSNWKGSDGAVLASLV